MAIAGDQMVKVDMEAAEALAELAQSGVRDGGGDVGGKWVTKGERAGKQVKSESRISESRLNTLDLLPMRSDLPQDSAVVPQQQCEKPYMDVKHDPLIKKFKAEKDAQLPVAAGVCTVSSSSVGCGRSRQNLTEAEKEARRIRRIFANRESARQTIRRRQALSEELTKKAAELSLENEKLKREKEKALKEYESLKLTNKLLKAQTDKAIKREVEQISGEGRSSRVQITPKSTSYPLLMYSHHPPFTHPYWPSTAQSPRPCQMHVVVPPSNAVMSNGLPDSPREQDHMSNANGHRPPYYVLPCSWFFPVFEQGNQLQLQSPSSRLKITPEESSLSFPVSGCTSKSILQENNPSSLPMKLEVRRKNQQLFPTAALSGVQNNYSPPKQTRNESCGPKDQLGWKKEVEVEAAAEARKRRKELTKLKNLHSRQCRS